MNNELPDVQTGFRKGRDQIANIRRIAEKAREFQKNINFCFIDYGKAFGWVDYHKQWKILKKMRIPDHFTWEFPVKSASWEICMQVKKQQLEQDMEQWTGFKLGNEYVEAVYCHPAYLAFMQSTSCEMLG